MDRATTERSLISGSALHAVKATGAFEGYNAFVDPALDVRLPEVRCAVSVTPLLRELLISLGKPAHLLRGGQRGLAPRDGASR